MMKINELNDRFKIYLLISSPERSVSPRITIWFGLSLMSHSPAELMAVSIEQFKFQFNQLYLQTVEKGSHLPLP